MASSRFIWVPNCASPADPGVALFRISQRGCRRALRVSDRHHGPAPQSRLLAFPAAHSDAWRRDTTGAPGTARLGGRCRQRSYTRVATAVARALASQYAVVWARGGLTVASGDAEGVNAALRHSTMELAGGPIAAVSSDVDRVYPGHHRNLATTSGARGAVVSPLVFAGVATGDVFSAAQSDAGRQRGTGRGTGCARTRRPRRESGGRTMAARRLKYGSPFSARRCSRTPRAAARQGDWRAAWVCRVQPQARRCRPTARAAGARAWRRCRATRG